MTCSSGSWDGSLSDRYCLRSPNIFRGVLKTLRAREASAWEDDFGAESEAEGRDIGEGNIGGRSNSNSGTGGRSGNACGISSLNRLGSRR